MSADSELEVMIDDARALGIFVDWIDAPRRTTCEAGRFLDDGRFYVLLTSGSEPRRCLKALGTALDRLMRFDDEPWFVDLTEGRRVAHGAW